MPNVSTVHTNMPTNQGFEEEFEGEEIAPYFNEETLQYVWPSGVPLTYAEARNHVRTADYTNASQTLYWLRELVDRVGSTLNPPPPTNAVNSEILDWIENSLQNCVENTQDTEHWDNTDEDPQYECNFDCGFMGSWNEVLEHEHHCVHYDPPPHLRNQ